MNKFKFCEYCRGTHIGACDKAAAARAVPVAPIMGLSNKDMDWLRSLTFCPHADKIESSAYDEGDDDTAGGGTLVNV